ncbi:beta-ketoacyl-ACP synthase III [Vagococcus jeotgali]|uniref:beta-ketoacyl-ACP synthase III n=1 Tax=Vagococcus jeotgali TaxID=3109030 RepID=UPI002DDBFD6D|nr:beta-ketoacyl-ACP synthase III [Vagococcus sp. B2T-5]
MLYPKITQVAHVLPTKVVSNSDLEAILDTSDEWIYSRTGIKERRVAIDESTSSLATEVGKILLQKANTKDVDFIIVATMTSDEATPSTACLVQDGLGLTQAFCFDINAACSGFIYALSVAEKFLLSQKYQKGMVIGVDVMSNLIDYSDRGTAVLFGDGAAGVLVENISSTPNFISELIQSDGNRYEALHGLSSNRSNPFKIVHNQSPYLLMNGKQIFDFVLRDVSKNMLQALKESGLEHEDIDFVLAHQANQRLLNALAKKINMPKEKFLSNVAYYGNTSSASVPLLLSESVDKKELVLGRNQKILFTGYGAGLTWGSLLINI